MRYHFPPIRMLSIKKWGKKTTNTDTGKAKNEFYHTICEMQISTAILNNRMKILKTILKIDHPSDPDITFPRRHSKEMN